MLFKLIICVGSEELHVLSKLIMLICVGSVDW